MDIPRRAQEGLKAFLERHETDIKEEVGDFGELRLTFFYAMKYWPGGSGHFERKGKQDG